MESLQQNEMFVLGMSKEDFENAIQTKNYELLSRYLFRIQKIATSNYMFRHHLETEINDSNEAKQSKRFYIIQSIGALETINPIKVKINNLGMIDKVS